VASSAVLAAGKKLWASEDWWSEAEWGGAGCWAKLLNENFVRKNMTSTITWSTIWSVYPGCADAAPPAGAGAARPT